MGKGIPAIPMARILIMYAYAHKMPYDGRPETMLRLMRHYAMTASYLN